MTKRHSIPRPRHLFPELSALLIEWKRSNLRAGRQFRRAIGRVPIWVTGSLAGIAGIMLAISLFFIHEPRVQAAVLPEPVPTLAVPPVPASLPVLPIEIKRPQLTAKIFRTHLPYAWDENRSSTLRSTPVPVKSAATRLSDVLWQHHQYREVSSPQFLSYLVKAAGTLVAGSQLVAANVVPAQSAPPGAGGLGILVEKSAVAGIPNEPLSYEIRIHNLSRMIIENLHVREAISASNRVTEVSPAAGVSGQELIWNFVNFSPGETRTLRITLIPEGAGEIETRTRVVPTSRVSAVVHVRTPQPASPLIEEILPTVPEEKPPAEPTRPLIQVLPAAPELKLSYTEVRALKQGDTLSMIFSVTNVGSAAAEDVILFVRLSGEFEHRYGEYVKHQIGSLQPGQTRRALLQATARDPGNAHLDASLTMQGAEKEARELKIPIRSGASQMSNTPEVPKRPATPVANRPVLDAESRWIAHEP